MSATDRITLSRERLRLALRPPEPPQGSYGDTPQTNTLPAWLHRLRTAPSTRVLASVLEVWWARQPMRVPLTLATQTGVVLLKPAAQKHPFKLVLCAAAAGGLVMWVRPWRWIPKTALLIGLIPPLVTEVLKQRNGSS